MTGFATTAMLLATTWALPVAPSVASPLDNTSKKLDLEKAALQILHLVNSLRKRHGAAPLRPHPTLAKAAAFFGGYMAQHDKYGHQADGRKPGDRAVQYGYQFALIRENIGYQFSSEGFTSKELADVFFKSWKESALHAKNMLDDDLLDSGIAICESPKTGRFYAVHLMGRPASARVSFEVYNDTKRPAKYFVADKEYTLPPRYTGTHRRNRPVQLRIVFPATSIDDKSNERKVTPVTGRRYSITNVDKSGYDLRVERIKTPAKETPSKETRPGQSPYFRPRSK